MKLWILSDLHLERFPCPNAFKMKRPDFDILVCAGDVLEGNCGEGFYVLRQLAGDKPVVFVMGNHEFWHSTVTAEMTKALKLAQRYNIVLLEGAEAEILGCHFIGGTLWTDYAFSGEGLDHTMPTGEKIETSLGYGRKRPFTIEDSVKLHSHMRHFLQKRIAVYSGSSPLVVLSHHAPLFECLPPNAHGALWAGNCASDLSSLINTGKISLWCHGHLHHSIDIKYQSGTRIVCNPAGYGFANQNFDEAFVVTL